jgi:hypothetical protein
VLGLLPGIDLPPGLIAGVAVGLLIGALVDLLATKSWPRDPARRGRPEMGSCRKRTTRTS